MDERAGHSGSELWPPVVIAHLSDLHLDETREAHERAQRVVSHLARATHPVDAVLVSGDISDRGSRSDYAAARVLLSCLPAPVLFCVGNHDQRAAFAAELLDWPSHRADTPVNQALSLAGVRILVLDSLVPGRAHGYLSPETLDWLEAQLAPAPAMPALVALHHPPIALGLPALDAIRLANAADLESVLTRHHNVVGVLCGHAHAAVASWFAGRPLRVAPGVRSTALLPWEPAPGTAGGPQAHPGACMTTEAPVALIFHTYAHRVLTTYVRPL